MRAFNALLSDLDQSATSMSVDHYVLGTSAEDRAEAGQAFFDKRKPVLRGN